MSRSSFRIQMELFPLKTSKQLLKQFNLKLCTILHFMMRSSSLQLYSAQDMSYHFVQHVHKAYITYS